MISKIFFYLALFISLAFAMQQGELAQERHRNCTGHLDCTSYYTPCAVDCLTHYLTLQTNLQGFLNAVNYDYELLFGVLDPNVIVQFEAPNNTYSGVCEVIELFEEIYTGDVEYVDVAEFEIEVQGENFAQAYVVFVFLDEESNPIGFFPTTIVFVKNVCGNWVQSIIATYYLY